MPVWAVAWQVHKMFHKCMSATCESETRTQVSGEVYFCYTSYCCQTVFTEFFTHRPDESCIFHVLEHILKLLDL